MTYLHMDIHTSDIALNVQYIHVHAEKHTSRAIHTCTGEKTRSMTDKNRFNLRKTYNTDVFAQTSAHMSATLRRKLITDPTHVCIKQGNGPTSSRNIGSGSDFEIHLVYLVSDMICYCLMTKYITMKLSQFRGHGIFM